MRKLIAAGVAAALMVTACAAAAATGMDRRLLAFFGGGQQAEELLLPGAMAVDVTAEDNGATLHATQVIRDRYSIAVAADFTAPEGTVLDESDPKRTFLGFGRSDKGWMELLNERGDPAGGDTGLSFRYRWHSLDDGDPTDNHLSLLLYFTVTSGLDRMQDAARFNLSAKDLTFADWEAVDECTVYEGDWSMELPLPQTDMGYSQQFDLEVGELDGVSIRLKEVYLSPITMMVVLEREEEFSADLSLEERKQEWARWAFALDGEHFAATNGYEPAVDRAVLTGRDGDQIPLECSDGSADLDIETCQYHHIFRLCEATDVAQLQGGTLTLRVGESSVDIPLDGLNAAG